MKVMGRSTVRTVDVAADGTGLCSRAGTALLPLVAARLGLVDGVCAALAGTRERRSAHDPGRAFCDLAVMLADGGRCVSDVAALAGQPSLFGQVASVSTAWRVLLSIGEDELDGVRQARARARERAWAAGAAPDRVILDFDATPISVHSEKELAAGHHKGGFGFNPLLVTCSREVLAGILRPGNAAAGNAADHLRCLDLALEQLIRCACVCLNANGSIALEHVRKEHVPREEMHQNAASLAIGYGTATVRVDDLDDRCWMEGLKYAPELVVVPLRPLGGDAHKRVAVPASHARVWKEVVFDGS